MKKSEVDSKVTVVNGVRVISSYIPDNRPPLNKWIRTMRISQVAWYTSPEGREKAMDIMAPVGIEYLTFWESIKQMIKNE